MDAEIVSAVIIMVAVIIIGVLLIRRGSYQENS
jgi:preprotein translocase subunit SecG